MTALPALRQVVLLTADLTAALDRARGFLGLSRGFREVAGMAELGFEHEVLAIDETFLEIVSPLTADSSPGRRLARTGDAGYMVVVQVADLAAVVARGADLGIAPVMHTVLEGNPISQWHPRDLGTLAEIDQMTTDEGWHFGTELAGTGRTDKVADITAVEIAVPDPEVHARRWAALLGVDIADGADTLVLGGRRVRFVPGTPAGLRAVELAASAGTPPGCTSLCGVQFTITGRTA